MIENKGKHDGSGGHYRKSVQSPNQNFVLKEIKKNYCFLTTYTHRKNAAPMKIYKLYDPGIITDVN